MTMAKTLYWVSTALLCLIYLAGAAVYLFQRPMVEQGMAHFGYPSYLITLLIAAKLAAPAALLARVSVRLSDLAYAGMFYHLLLALSAHLNAGDGGFVPSIIGLALLVTSFLTQNAGRKRASPNAPALFALQRNLS
jgi:hypothetical protein